MNIDDAFGIHPQALVLRARRAELLAANLANADTPGYKARDFDFGALLQAETVAPVRLRTTDARHLHDQPGPVPSGRLGYRVPSQPSLDGNTVDSQLEYSAYATNALEYQASLRFLTGKIQGLLRAFKGE